MPMLEAFVGVADNVSVSERSDLGFWRAQNTNIRDWISLVVRFACNLK